MTSHDELSYYLSQGLAIRVDGITISDVNLEHINLILNEDDSYMKEYVNDQEGEIYDNNLSCCSISHLDDVDALLQAVDLHTIDCVDAFCCIYCRTVLDILDASSYTASTLS